MKNPPANLKGHVRNVKYVINSQEDEWPKASFKVLARMRCDKLLVAKELRLLRDDGMGNVILLSLATRLEKRIAKHLKECKVCRIAKKTMRKSLSKNARA